MTDQAIGFPFQIAEIQIVRNYFFLTLGTF